MRIADFKFESSGPQHTVEPVTAAQGALRVLQAETAVSRFAFWAARHPAAPAIVDENGSISYGDLDALSNRIARWLLDVGLKPEDRVVVMMGRHRGYLAAALGAMKAGGVYVPLDPAQPLSRRRELVTIAGAEIAITDRDGVGDVRRLFWQCPTLGHALCLDADRPETLTEAPTAVMSAELWDHIAAAEADDVEAGGWKSAFTGQPLPESAMAAFGANARAKLAPLLTPQSRVLEIGCASGFTMRHVAPLCGHYVASDISRLNAERAEAVARRLGLAHVAGRHLASHDIDLLPAGSFDAIVLNSVVESFPGFGYLESVLNKAVALLRPGGILFFGNIWDLDRKQAYLSDLAAFARDHAGAGYRTRLDMDDNFFVPKAFLRDWAASRLDPPSLDFSNIDADGFDPAPYGFDLVVRMDGKGDLVAPRHMLEGNDALLMFPPLPSPTALAPDRAAYVMFTSGTTGTPKAALIEHKSLVNLAAAVDAELLGPLAQGRQLAITCNFAFGFDGSIHQIFSTLLNGHTLHICSDETRRDPAALHDFLARHRIDVCDATPSLFALLVDYCVDTDKPVSVRRFILGGEVIRPETLRRFYEIRDHRNIVVVNQYGPSETCVCATQYIMTAGNWSEITPPPIGVALPGVAVRLADSKGREVPDGVPGEIWIGGVQVARGYLGDEVRTAERFIMDSSQRWYRTGDMARRVRGGLLQFMGREDRQVKIRGNRTELGELEARIAAHPLVRQVAVSALDLRGGGDRELVAFVVPRDGFDAAQARAALEASLPAWLVPSHIVTLDALPLNANGKLDEARLPRPDQRIVPVSKPLTTETEQRLAAIWAEVLDRPILDGEDDFFLCGGHSVLAVRLVSKVEAAFSIRLPLADLFGHATVASMARLIDERRGGAAWRAVVEINAEGSRVPLVCFHPVGGNVLCYRELAAALGPDQPVFMVQSYGLEEGQPLLDSVEAQAGAYLKALRPVLRGRPLAVAGWSFGGLLAWEAACQLHRAGADLRAVIVLDGVAAPDPVRELLQKDEADYLAALFDEMGLFDAETLRPLTPEQRIDLIIERGKGGHFLPDGVDRAAMRRLLALFQNNGLAAVRYRPRAFDGRMLLVRPRELSKQAPGLAGDPLNGWSGLARDGVELRWMDGTHGQMLHQPWLAELAEHVRSWLDAVNR